MAQCNDVTRHAITCDMERNCTGAVSYIDNKGYVYCTVHGAMRRFIRPARRLTPGELATIEAGGTIKY